MPVYALTEELLFPDPRHADPSGLLAVGGDLRPERLVLAYAMGIFPWPMPGLPLAWFSPPVRMVLPPSELHVSRRLRSTLRQKRFRVTADIAFDQVIRRCAEPHRRRELSTWITPDMLRAYTALHELGFAHSVESWLDGRLVGGIYGVSIGTSFCGESMFYDQSNASKVAFVGLVRQLARWRFALMDCQVPTKHVARYGARLWPRDRFLEVLAEAVRAPTRRGKWVLDES